MDMYAILFTKWFDSQKLAHKSHSFWESVYTGSMFPIHKKEPLINS